MMTDIHDIRPVLPPDYGPLIIFVAILLILLGIIGYQVIKQLRALSKKKPAEYAPPAHFKDTTLAELETIRTQLQNTEEPDISYFASRLHNTVKWYLSHKLRMRLSSGTLTEIIGYVPQTFSPIVTFCYAVIYQWQKRTRADLVAFIDNSIDVVKNDI